MISSLRLVLEYLVYGVAVFLGAELGCTKQLLLLAPFGGEFYSTSNTSSGCNRRLVSSLAEASAGALPVCALLVCLAGFSVLLAICE
jgi:hypothetical protein